MTDHLKDAREALAELQPHASARNLEDTDIADAIDQSHRCLSAILSALTELQERVGRLDSEQSAPSEDSGGGLRGMVELWVRQHVCTEVMAGEFRCEDAECDHCAFREALGDVPPEACMTRFAARTPSRPTAEAPTADQLAPRVHQLRGALRSVAVACEDEGGDFAASVAKKARDAIGSASAYGGRTVKLPRHTKAIESGEMTAPFVEQQSPERLTGASESKPVSSEDWIPAGSALPYVQVGMVIRRSAGGPRLVVEDIYDPRYPMALCRSGLGKEVRILCAELRENYRLLESFTPNHMATSI